MARPQIFVLDASVAVKWYVEEELREQALVLRQDFYEGRLFLLSQALLLYEVANALRYHPGLSPEDVVASMRSLQDMQLDIVAPGESQVETAVKTAFEENISMYDAMYLALADVTGSRLLTADESLYDNLSKERKRLVLLLRDYGKARTNI